MNRVLFLLLCTFSTGVFSEDQKNYAVVLRDQVVLRPAPRASAKPNALLWQGETLEVRGERLDYLQVYDYRRERGGYVRATELRRLSFKPEEAPELLALVRFLRDVPGSEALGIGLAAAWFEAAPAQAVNGAAGVEALDLLGTLAERLARRASAGKAVPAVLSAQLDVASRYGVRFVTYEREGRMALCYDGASFRRLLAMTSSPEQRAHAALALTDPRCMAGDLRVAERRQLDEWRAQVLDKVDAAALPPFVRNRVLMREAGIWAGLAYQRVRQGEPAQAAAARALKALGAVDKGELADGDRTAYSEAAMRVSASRWATVARPPEAGKRPHIVTAAGAPGETCILLVDEKSSAEKPLAKRCTYAVVWTASATLNREGDALAVAVQPTETWRELWVFRKTSRAWSVRVMPPAAVNPSLGYAEFAGWVPGGARMLVAREALGDGRHSRNFELVRLDTMTSVGQAADPSGLAVFQRWQDPAWKRDTLALR